MEKYYFESIGATLDIPGLKDKLKLYDDDIAFIAGSLVEGSINPMSFGMGNKRSDIDVFIVRKKGKMNNISREDGYDYGSYKVSFDRFDNFGVDIEYFALEDIQELISQLNDINLSSDNGNLRIRNWFRMPEGMLLENFLSFLHRFYYSVNIGDERNYKEMKQMIDYECYFRYMVLKTITAIDNSYEDVIGNYEAGKLTVAVNCVRSVMDMALLAYCYSVRQSLDRIKWVTFRMSNIATEDLKAEKIWKKYKHLLYEESLTDDASFKRNIEDTLNLIEFTVGAIRKNIQL